MEKSRWELDPNTGDPNYGTRIIDETWEFRYDGPRERSLVRQVDPATRLPDPNLPAARWTDYIGDMPYLDYTTAQAGGSPTNQTDYLFGLGPRPAGRRAAQVPAFRRPRAPSAAGGCVLDLERTERISGVRDGYRAIFWSSGRLSSASSSGSGGRAVRAAGEVRSAGAGSCVTRRRLGGTTGCCNG